MPRPAVVSLFSGAGGLDLGFRDAGFSIKLAIDNSAAAILTHQRNFPGTRSLCRDLTTLGPDGVLAELKASLEPGSRLGVIGGPPCQGFSRANTSAADSDPRNELPLLYLRVIDRIAEEYQLEFVLFENVLGIRDKRHAHTFDQIQATLHDMDLSCRVGTYSAADFCVPQRRERVIIAAFANPIVAAGFQPAKTSERDLTVRDTIDGLPDPTFFPLRPEDAVTPLHPNHWTMKPRSPRFTRPHSMNAQGRSFKRLEWDQPSPTVAYGHREIHVHPEGRRRLSIYEAMLLQGFPSDFILEGTLSEQVDQVSNAVPPPLARALARAIAEPLEHTSRTAKAAIEPERLTPSA